MPLRKVVVPHNLCSGGILFKTHKSSFNLIKEFFGGTINFKRVTMHFKKYSVIIVSHKNFFSRFQK